MTPRAAAIAPGGAQPFKRSLLRSSHVVGRRGREATGRNYEIREVGLTMTSGRIAKIATMGQRIRAGTRARKSGGTGPGFSPANEWF